MPKVDVCAKCGEEVRRTLASSHACDIDRERLARNLASIARILSKWAATG